MKKQFSIPHVVLMGDEPAETPWYGTGSNGQNSIRPVPMSFAEWAQSRWCADYDNSGAVTVDDFAKWWATAGLGETAWAQFNPGLAWNPDVTK